MAQVGLYVDDGQRRAWRLAAVNAGVTLSEWIRQACDAALAQGHVVDRAPQMAAELRAIMARHGYPPYPSDATALLAPPSAQQRASSVPPSTPDSVAQLPGDPKGKSPRDMTEQEFAAWRATVVAEEQQQQATD